MSHPNNPVTLNMLRALAEELARQQVRFVFAESCTGGLVSATLAEIPGISDWHCGSMVVYRGASKIDWLSIDAADVHHDSAVNAPVAEQMAERVLRMTTEADWSASVTGHLGPGSPPELDGVIYVGVARRKDQSILVQCHRKQLPVASRVDRQRRAAAEVLKLLLENIAGDRGPA